MLAVNKLDYPHNHFFFFLVEILLLLIAQFGMNNAILM